MRQTSYTKTARANIGTPLSSKMDLFFDNAGKLCSIDSTRLITEIGSGGIKSYTHSQLLALKNGSNLTPGSFYSISDFKTKYQQPVTNVIKESLTFETLILIATSTNTFDIRVQSV